MDITINNSNNRARLSREDLLAGRCFPDEIRVDDADPRIKSPDLILDRNPTALIKPKNPDPMERIAKLECELIETKQRYNTEIDKWKVYEEQVTSWKEQVMRVVRQLQDDIAQKNELINRLKNSR